MRTINKGKVWEIRSSLWLILAFIYFINWSAFFYIGMRAKYKKWILFGWMYFFLTFICGISSTNAPKESPLITISIISWVVSIIHAFLIRREYLIRRETIVDNKRNTVNISKNDPVVPLSSLDGCKAAVEKYLNEDKSTPFFREKLTAIFKRIDTFSSRCDNIKNVIIERFGSVGVSYDKFAAPVTALQEYLITLTNSLVSRMKMFDEAEYSNMIKEFTETNRTDDAAGYIELEQEYKDYAEKTLLAFDDAILKLDRLMLEISKISDTDVERAMNIMCDLDSAIKDTRFYK